MKKIISPKILFLDIETLPMEVYAWDLWNPNSVEGIKQRATILSIQYKWQHEDKAHAFSVLNTLFEFNTKTMKAIKGKELGKTISHVREDKYILWEFRRLLEEADMVVTQNGRKFDIKWIHGVNRIHGMDPLPDTTHFDTLLKCKSKYKLASYKLDYLAKVFNLPQKKAKTSYVWWVKAAEGDVDSIKRIVKYGIQDVYVLEALYNKIVRDFPALIKIDHGIKPVTKCEHCGSKKLRSNGFRFTANKKYQRLQCATCGTWMRGLVL